MPALLFGSTRLREVLGRAEFAEQEGAALLASRDWNDSSAGSKLETLNM